MWSHELLGDAELREMDKLPKNIPIDLLAEYDQTVEKDGSIENRAKYNAIMAQFADDFHLISREVFSAIMEEDLGKIWKKLNELEKAFKQHRHSFDKPYSEKPAW